VRILLAFLVATFCSSCVSRSQVSRPPRGLEDAFFFVEEPLREGHIALSGDLVTKTPVTRVVEHAEVDTNSVIRIHVDATRLAAAGGDPAQAARLRDLEAEKSKLVELVQLYGAWLAARAGALEAFAKTLELPPERLADPDDPDVARFVARRDAIDVQKSAILDALIERYDQDDDKFARIETIAMDTALPGLDGFLNDEIDALTALIATEKKALETASETQGAASTLRLEAFLLSDDAEPRAMHLQHYDSLDDERVDVQESAFDISLAELAQLAAVARDMAAAAESVRKEEASLGIAFRKISPKLADRLEALHADLVALRDRTTEQALKELVTASTKALDAFLETTWIRLGTLADERTNAARASFQQKFAAELELVRQTLTAWESLQSRVEKLRDALRTFDATKLPEFVAEADAARKDAERVLTGIQAIAADAPSFLARFEAVLASEVARLAPEAREQILASWKESGAESTLDRWVELHELALSVLEQTRVLLGIGGVTPLPANMHVPEAFDVPITEVKDTHIDLTRTRRKSGDEIVFRATLTAPGVEVDPMEARFGVERFGWHDSLEPSVVLVEPDRLAGSDGDVRFAPALVWAWSYYPRSDEQGWWVDSARFLQPSAGIHAILLDFDDENTTEIGLGATVSIWESRIQFGIGWNLMADSDGDGRTYYYVGSSLIPLLQALGESDGS
jgi:hypothetical protein